jgi:uncharacterized lipoprotein
MLNRMQLTAAAVLLIAGCGSPASHSKRPANSTEDSAGRRSVTFHVPGMNEQLQIL